MVLIRDCDADGKLISPTDPNERDQLRKECLRHATGPDGIIDWDKYYFGLHGEELFSDLSSDSSVDSGRDSDCVILSATPGTQGRQEDFQDNSPPQELLPGSDDEGSFVNSVEMVTFADEVRMEESLYIDVSAVDQFRSNFDISATGNEEDVVLLSCDPDERVCDQEMAGEGDESYFVYTTFLEEFGVKIPFTPFEMDVLKFLNVAPTQIRPNSWAFIRAFEILCKALGLEPSVGAFLCFYGTKDVNKGTWIAICAHPGKRLFPQYACNFKKEWRDTFVRVQGLPGCSTSSVLLDGKPKFPLRWTNNPLAVRGYDLDAMSSYERTLVQFLEEVPLTKINELLNREGDETRLTAYLRECPTWPCLSYFCWFPFCFY
jgi:hypothetical protein